ncbi:N-acetylgalactosamine-N,N'-diacetylbacillosaminyl-diphospho-undecaprenol 4-alpha-N-acetylgalactosaminyltransferase [Hyunsoonleella jejuensis]|uniref:N-acetylgalactosamine-N,N'-diacetylbacillosaminyl-diphospho-undecaprenol 4-alpha-N-acetylgalactosaminyltransferase n=1 Tax=Hyunsoonleella jejuensis TaxID=419940 RepID=A0A1H9G731_9FLAO|nr:glycosyltransferase [Hyunsoonleella jejuensis]SEQ45946.1 N-acetylgalactosamine-N,N'-diacetylbacillosaminyl-diphospho-undecaprenol 4-alpha-N-acetylgalactosaminyltransferase [Hyunsoonleella jejuensis]
MTLGILIYSLAGGGAERVVSHLLSFCIANKIEVHLILMNDTIKYEVPQNINIHFIEKSNSNESGINKTLKIPFLAFKYAKLIKKLGITHSLGFLTRPSFINIISINLTKHSFKIITNERAYPSLQYGYKNFQSFFNKRMIKLLYKKSHLVISNSQGNANDLIENFGVPKDKMRVIHNPIDLEKINTIKPITNFFDEKSFNIVTLGRLTKGKNHTMLIEAVYRTKNSSIKLYIFGLGELQNELEVLIDKLNLKNQVKLMGFDPNPYKYLKSADLFIFGSNHEGFPNVLLEAMSCGLPILSTNCKSGPDEIMELKDLKDDIMLTDYGILVPTNDVRLMTKGINYFKSNKGFLKSCKRNVLKRSNDFKKNKVLNEYINVIRESH